MWRPSWRTCLKSWPAAKLNLAVMSAAFLVFGLSLAFQSRRWASTPAYHVLLEIFPAPAWGGLFFLSGAALGAAAWQLGRRRWVIITALIPAFGLTTGWMLSFVVRYLTSPSTTPETWVSWALFDFLLVKVAIAMDPPDPPDPPAADLARQAIAEARSAMLRAEEAYARAAGQPVRHQDPP